MNALNKIFKNKPLLKTGICYHVDIILDLQIPLASFSLPEEYSCQ